MHSTFMGAGFIIAANENLVTEVREKVARNAGRAVIAACTGDAVVAVLEWNGRALVA